MSPSTESGGGSRAPLFDEADDGTLVSTDADEAKRMDAIQAAVTDILATENQQDARSSMNRQSSEQSSEQGTGGHSTVSMGERRAMFEDSEDNPFDEQAIDAAGVLHRVRQPAAGRSACQADARGPAPA